MAKIPIAAVFAIVPFVTGQEMNAWLHYGGGLELWRELYAPFGIVPLAAGNSGISEQAYINAREAVAGIP